MMTKKILIVGVTAYLSTMLAANPSFADTKYTSKNGNLVVQYGNKCSTVKPSGFYRFQNGRKGNLIALDCTSIGGDIAEHQFIDTNGKQRCYGRMTQIWGGGKVATIWEIKAAVSGYRCEQTGKKLEIEMDSGKQI